MECETYNPWLSAYLDGELTQTHTTLLEGHLSGCAACASELTALRGALHLLRGLDAEEPPADLRPRILAALRATRPSPFAGLIAAFRLPSIRLAGGLSAAAAATAVVLFSTTGAPVSRERSPGAQAAKPTPAKTRVTSASTSVRTGEAKRRSTVAKSSTPAPAKPALIAREEKPKAVASTASVGASARPGSASAPKIALVSARPLSRAERRERDRADAKKRERGGPATRADQTEIATRPSSSTPNATRRERPEPVVSADTTPAPNGPIVSHESDDDPMTMMASMPMESMDHDSANGTGNNDPLTSLRRRLAEERRAVPTIPAEEIGHSARMMPAPVRIEF